MEKELGEVASSLLFYCLLIIFERFQDIFELHLHLFSERDVTETGAQGTLRLSGLNEKGFSDKPPRTGSSPS